MEKEKNNIKIALLIIGIIMLISVLYLLTYFKSVNVAEIEQDIPAATKAPFNQGELSDNYKEEIKKIFSSLLEVTGEYYAGIEGTSSPARALSDKGQAETEMIENLSRLKIDIMNLRVPESKRDMHLSLVVAIDDMKKALDKGEKEAYKVEYGKILDLEKKIP